MKNVETCIPAIVEQLSGEPDLSSLNEPVEVWSSGLKNLMPPAGVGFFASEAEAWEYRGRYIDVSACYGPVWLTTFEERKETAKVHGLLSVNQLNGKGEVLRTWVVE